METAQQISLDFQWLRKKPQQFVIGTDIDYYKLFYAIKTHSSASYLFESLSLPKHQDRYFTIGFDPLLQFIAKGNELQISGDSRALERTTGIPNQKEVRLTDLNPYDYLKSNIELDHYAQMHQGGLVGYFCYEAVNYFEPAVNFAEHHDFATFHLGLYTDGLIFDSTTGVLSYYTFTEEDRSDFVTNLIDQLDEVIIPEQFESVEFLGRSESKEEHAQAVLNTLEEVRAGNSFQSEVGFKTQYNIQGDKISVYHKLRKINPSPYMFYVKFAEIELMGASPEILVSNINGRVLTTPTAGTIRRGKDAHEDRVLARTLLTDKKEIAEHNMLVDLHRNDISRVCDIGSVKVIDLMYIIRFSHVQHIVSDIVGELSADKNAFDLLASILPAGVLTGTPKIETMKIINQNEKTPRGPYGGAVGRFSFNGDSTFCMPIRSLFCSGDQCFTQTSSGVVYDSNVDREYEEICEKLAAMEQTIKKVGESDES